MITGVGIETADEGRREEYLRDVLAIASDAIDGGIDLRGLWWDTAIDPGWVRSGQAGPGLFDRDRAAKPAADLFASVASGRPIPS